MPTLLSPAESWAVRQMVFAGVLDELDREFALLRLPYMPIKGAWLICAGIADKLPDRNMLDIDLLVRPADFDKVTEHFLHHPRAAPRKNYWPFESSFYFGESRVYVEIHRQLNYPERFLLPPETLFARASPSTGMRCLLLPDDALLVLACHALVHIGIGLPATIFDEIRLIAGQPGFSWERFWKNADATGIGGFVRLLIRWAGREAGGDLQVSGRMPLYAAAWSRILTFKRYRAMPVFVRRALLELPMMRDPVRFFLCHGFR
jgi:hypothetical protein